MSERRTGMVVLRGMSFFITNFWPRFYTAGAVKELAKSWESSVVRAAMGIEPKNGYKEKPDESKQIIKTVVDAAIKEGIYVIIDCTATTSILLKPKLSSQKWQQLMASSQNVIYEIFNEPDYESWAEVKAYSR
ncbi:glycoside hydrolase family 5 protein, partial [Nostoc sp. HG1]|nr:glycoside hydrolase family 5 protein [Nostoc sp. HG1]